MSDRVRLLGALADPTRLRILLALKENELSVAELQEVLGVGQSRISNHLSLLKGAGLVRDRREGQKTGRKMRLWDGDCYVHMEFTASSIDKIRQEHPEAPVVAHPECTRAVRALADEVCSTEKMVSFCKNNPARAFIVVTEEGMLHRLRREMPEKTFIPGPTDHCACSECRYMKMNTLEKAVSALENLTPEVVLDQETIERAKNPIERMLEWSRN